MVNKKISELDPAATITGTETVPLLQAGTTVAATVQQLLALIVAGAPGNLDTFFEVATQMGLDEATVATLQALVAGKADAAQVAATGGANVFTGTNVFTGPVALGAGASTVNPRQPFLTYEQVDATTGGVNDKAAHSLNAIFTGNFATATGTNAQFGFGLSMFTTTGTAAGDANGANLTNIIESDVRSPSGTLPVVQGLVTQAAFGGPVAAAHVGQMESLRVAAPTRKDGATAGTADSIYGLFVEAVNVGDVGSATALSLYVEDGITRFGGRTDITNVLANAGSGDLSIYAGYSTTDGASIVMQKAGNGGHFVMGVNTPGAFLFVHDGSNVKHAFSRAGLMGVGGYPDQAGGTGAAIWLANTTTTPPGNPSGGGLLYSEGGILKWKGPNGTVTTLGMA